MKAKTNVKAGSHTTNQAAIAVLQLLFAQQA
jgi:hypothetical protein